MAYWFPTIINNNGSFVFCVCLRERQFLMMFVRADLFPPLESWNGSMAKVSDASQLSEKCNKSGASQSEQQSSVKLFFLMLWILLLSVPFCFCSVTGKLNYSCFYFVKSFVRKKAKTEKALLKSEGGDGLWHTNANGSLAAPYCSHSLW